MRELQLGMVILHYMNTEDTKECVQSFVQNLDTRSYHIVIVDNASPNGSGEALEACYAGNPKITVIRNPENLGFSAGNNVGIAYIRQHFAPEFVILSNNDIILLEKQMYSKLSAEYAADPFAVLGPMILTADGRCDSNPIFDLPYTKEAALFQKKFHERKLKRYQSRLYPWNEKLWQFGRRIQNRLGMVKRVNRKDRKPGSFLQKQDGIVLHGCFLVFSHQYFQHFQGLDARTFLYAEEDILHRHMLHHGLRMCYDPEILVYHKEGRSIASANKASREKTVFVSQNAIQAIGAYLELLEEYEGKC